MHDLYTGKGIIDFNYRYANTAIFNIVLPMVESGEMWWNQ